VPDLAGDVPLEPLGPEMLADEEARIVRKLAVA
jgi:hypothetical protein